MARPLGPRARWPYALYLVVAALAVLSSARLFYGYMLQQTGGEWSAPLDDVFIHFDYARATARGFPFQWSEGNGYSSGNTSLTYPFALAFGYWVGFRGQALMIWAALLAMGCVFGYLAAVWRLFPAIFPGARLLAIVSTFSVGALSWSLWSGMEVSFFLGVWALAAWLAAELVDGTLRPRVGGPLLSAACVLLVTTRPEASTSVAALALWVGFSTLRRRGFRRAATGVVLIALPAAGALVAQALVNYALTGESAANGAIVKLALYHPYMTSAEKLADWQQNLRYAFDRIHKHHFGEIEPWGRVPFWLSFLGLVDRRTRGVTLMLLATILGWTLLVALNGQVRWQNERYLMPAVAWELLAAAVGVAAAVAPARRARLRWPRAAVAVAATSWLVFQFWAGERVQYRDQVWFFARACRNIRDQHLTVGRMLLELDPRPRRVMVGDAGAITYASDLAGFDLIGLGGYHDLPLARAGTQGLAATLELVERMKPAERPDVMAIYPTWWGPLPQWFGHRLFGVPVLGNVICGGYEKVVYQTDWHLLGTGEKPSSVPAGARVVDAVDVADLVSEKEHGLEFPHPSGGYADMRVLPDPQDDRQDLWDAGRHVGQGRALTMRLAHLPTSPDLRLVFRVTADHPVHLDVAIGKRRVEVNAPAGPGWKELAVPLQPADGAAFDLRIVPIADELEIYHVWVVDGPQGT